LLPFPLRLPQPLLLLLSGKRKKKKIKTDSIIKTFTEKSSEDQLQVEAMRNKVATERIELERTKLGGDIKASQQAAEIARYTMYKELGFSKGKILDLLALPRD